MAKRDSGIFCVTDCLFLEGVTFPVSASPLTSHKDSPQEPNLKYNEMTLEHNEIYFCVYFDEIQNSQQKEVRIAKLQEKAEHAPRKGTPHM